MTRIVGEDGLESSAGIWAEAPPIQAEALLEKLGGVVSVVDELDLTGRRHQLYHVSDDRSRQLKKETGTNRFVKDASCRHGAQEPGRAWLLLK